MSAESRVLSAEEPIGRHMKCNLSREQNADAG
jgi:hypothetical protein